MDFANDFHFHSSQDYKKYSKQRREECFKRRDLKRMKKRDEQVKEISSKTTNCWADDCFGFCDVQCKIHDPDYIDAHKSIVTL